MSAPDPAGAPAPGAIALKDEAGGRVWLHPAVPDWAVDAHVLRAHAQANPPLRTLVLAVTDRCNIGCDFCCHPHAESEIADEDCIRLVTEACEGEFVVVALTGGEPFLRLPLVLRLAAITRAHGRLLTVLTNGYWAPQADRAGDVARRLVDAGAFKVTFSWDPSHAHFIPASAIQNGLEACMAAGLHGPCTLCGTILQGPDAAELLRAARLPG